MISLRHAQNITPIGLKALGRLTSVEKLLLFNTSKLSPTGLSCFFASSLECKFQQTLKYLNLSGSKTVVGQDYKNEPCFVTEVKSLLKQIICENCPNVEYIVTETELVSI